MRCRFRVGLLVLALTELTAAFAVAIWLNTGYPTQPSVEPPRSHAGRQLAWLVATINEAPPEAELRSRFTKDFLAAVPIEELSSQLASLRRAGPYQLVGATSRSLTVDFAIAGRRKAWVGALEVERGPPHRIQQFYLEQEPAELPEPAQSWDQVSNRLAESAEDVGFLAAEVIGGQCRPVHVVEADKPLGLASAFKLYVLGAATEAVEAGRLSWDTPIPVREELRVHSSTRLAELAPGSSVILRELASHMIRESDNTATDLIIDAVGREAVEAAMVRMGMAKPERNRPLLSVGELSLILWGRPPLIDEYVSLDEAARRRFVSERLAGRPSTIGEVLPTDEPRAVNTVQWFASANDLCRAHIALQDSARRAGNRVVRQIVGDPMTQPGNQVAYAASKGGELPGVLVGSWYFEMRDGRRFAVSVLMASRSGAVDRLALDSIFHDAARLLAREER